jgi:hypothetical protein
MEEGKFHKQKGRAYDIRTAARPNPDLSALLQDARLSITSNTSVASH